MFKKIIAFGICALGLVGCSKHDPILPGVRYDIFDTYEVNVQNKDVPELSGVAKNISGDDNCEYRQDEKNNIWRGDKKIFSGFANDNVVKSNQSPICVGNFIYTGLSTGEVIKVNTNTRQPVWVADVVKNSNLTGGASVVDIVAHVGVDGNYVYAGGLGDAFCKINANTGNKIWCANISVPVDFIIVDNFAFVVGADNNLYAIDTKSGETYWRTEIKKQVKPVFKENFIVVGKQRINYKNGSLIR